MARIPFSTLLALGVATVLFGGDRPVLPEILDPQKQPQTLIDPSPFVRTGPTIQVAILLDTSNSMDGLINQARAQIWKIINALSEANKHKQGVVLQVALFEYGKSSLSSMQGYQQMLSPLTNDLDFLSEKLFGLHTNGGSEYAGWTIGEAVRRLQWSKHVDDLRLIIIAGNESFAQGERPYVEAIRAARREAIVVNTIFCGERSSGINLLWEEGSRLGSGVYMNIDHMAKIRHVDTPYDDEIVHLGDQLNQTFVAYGRKGAVGKMRQKREDANAMGLSKQALVERSMAKSTKQYKTDSWDLASAYVSNRAVVAEVAEEELPEELKGKDEAQIKDHLEAQLEKRRKIESQIGELKQKRRKYISEHQPKTQKDLGTVLVENVRAIAMKNGFVFK